MLRYIRKTGPGSLWRKNALFLIALLAFCGFWGVALTGSLTPLQPQRTANQQAKSEKRGAKPANESVQDIAAQTVAYYTEVLAWFTAILAGVGGAQGVLILWQIMQARKEFAMAHRPKVIVRNFDVDRDLPSGKLINIQFRAYNRGDSPADIVRLYGRILIHSGDLPPPNIAFRHVQDFEIPLDPGERELFHIEDGTKPNDVQTTAIYAGGQHLYCIGIVSYADKRGTKRETGFCRRYRPRADQWETVDCEYEYDY